MQVKISTDNAEILSRFRILPHIFMHGQKYSIKVYNNIFTDGSFYVQFKRYRSRSTSCIQLKDLNKNYRLEDGQLFYKVIHNSTWQNAEKLR